MAYDSSEKFNAWRRAHRAKPGVREQENAAARASGYDKRPEVKARKNAQRRERYRKNPDKHKAIRLMRDYGLSMDDYNCMLDEQNNLCAICKQPETGMRNGKAISLSVDHDHITGKVRQLLCLACNVFIGLLEKDPQRYEQAAKYIQKHSENLDGK